MPVQPCIFFAERILTDRPASFLDATKQAFQLFLILGPLATDQWHAHDHQTPAQYGNPSEGVLCEPSTASQHAGADSQGLNEVEIGPLDVVCDQDCAFTNRQVISGQDDVCSIRVFANALHSTPYSLCNGTSKVVGGCGKDESEWKQTGQQQVSDQDMGEPGSKGQKSKAQQQEQASNDLPIRGCHRQGASTHKDWLACGLAACAVQKCYVVGASFRLRKRGGIEIDPTGRLAQAARHEKARKWASTRSLLV